MKRLYNVLLVTVASCFTACSTEEINVPSYLKVGMDTIHANAQGLIVKLPVSSSDHWAAGYDTKTDWVKFEYTQEGEYLPIWISANPTDSARSTVLTINNKTIREKVYIEQEGRKREFDPTNDIIIGIEELKAKDAGFQKWVDQNIDSSYLCPFKKEEPVELEFILGANAYVDYLRYYPHAKGGTLKEVEVYYLSETTTSYNLLGTIEFSQSNQVQSVELPVALTKPTHIKLKVVSTWDDKIGGVELSFLEMKERESFEIFTDQTYSVLNTLTTQLHIDQMQAGSKKDIAQQLFDGTYPVNDRVKEYIPHRNASKIGSELKITTYSRHDNPTGIYVEQGDTLTLYVDKLNGYLPNIEFVDWEKGLSSKSLQLRGGENTIVAPTKGLCYIIYNTEDYKRLPKLKIHILGGEINGVFDKTKHSVADWATMLERAEVSGYLDLMGQYVHWMFPIDKFKTHVTDPIALLNAYDEMMALQYDFMGLVKYNRPIVNRLLFCHIDPNAESQNPNASSYRVAFPIGNAKAWLHLETYRKSPWGPAHEAGHMHQTRPGLKWVGTTETTNNLHSLLTQIAFGNESRLVTGKHYEEVLQSIVVAGINHAEGGGSSAFAKLVPFWQLHLYATEILGGEFTDFYKDIHEQIRVKPKMSNEGEHQLDFVRMSCHTLKRDLTPFFEDMGFLRPIDKEIGDYTPAHMTITQEQIDALKLEIDTCNYETGAPIIYLKDNNIELFKQTEYAAGTTTNTGSSIVFNDWTGMVGYEIFVGEKRVGASHTPEVTIPAGVDATNITAYGITPDGSKISAQL